MNDRTPDPNSAPRPKRRGRRALVWCLCLASPWLLATLILATPGGQRRAVGWALDGLQRTLPEQAEPTAFRLGGVALGVRPLGVVLQDLHWQREGPGGDTLVSIRALTAQPADASGRNWGLIQLDGVHVHHGLWPQLDAWMGATAEETPPSDSPGALRMEDIHLSQLTWDGGPFVSDSIFLEGGQVDHLHVEGLQYIEGQSRVQHLEGAGHVELRHRDGMGADLTLSVEGSDSLFQCALAPTLLDTSRVPATWKPLLPWWPDHIHATWALETTSWMADVQWPWGRAVGEGTLLGSHMQLTSLTLDAPGFPVNLSPLPPGHVFADLRGPLLFPIDRVTQGQWDGMSGQLSVEAALSRPGDSPLRCTVDWSPETGDFEGMATLSAHAMPQTLGHAVRIQAEGQWPWNGDDWTAPLKLKGSWDVHADDVAPSLQSAGGLWTMELSPSERGIELSTRLEGRAMPLALTPQLELYGDLRMRLDAVVGTRDVAAPWSGQIDVLDARWIPKAGFGQSTAAGPPLSMKRWTAFLNGEGQRVQCQLEGDFIRGTIQGPLDEAGWTTPLHAALSESGWQEPQHHPPASAPWSVHLELLRDDLLERWSNGRHSVGPGSRIRGTWNGTALTARLDLTGAHFGPWRTGSTSLTLESDSVPLALQLDVAQLRHAQYGALDALDVDVVSVGERASSVAASWQGAVSGEFQVRHGLQDAGRHELEWLRGQLDVYGRRWELDTRAPARMVWTGTDWTSLDVEHWHWQGALGDLIVGRPTAPSHAAGHLVAEMNGWPMAAWGEWASSLVGASLPQLAGNLNGSVKVDLSDRGAEASVQWQDAQTDGFEFGDVCIQGDWANGAWAATLQQFEGERQTSRVAMGWDRQLEADLERWPLSTLDPLLAKGGVHVDGELDGHLHVDFSGPTPKPRGQLTFQAPLVEVEATGSALEVEGILSLTPDYIGLDHATVTDPNGGIAFLNLSVLHTDFAEWNYDVDLDFSDAPFQLMDLAPAPQRLFHGTVEATGRLNVFGDGHGVIIESELTSADGTAFALPLDALDGAELPTGIRFVGGSGELPPTPRKAPFGVTLDLEVDVTPDAEVTLLLDSRAGERVDGRAEGHIAIGMSPEAPLSMEGGISVVDGAYRFSLRDLFTKRIAIAPGGRIDWDGDPYAAELNLTALSRHRATPLPLLPGLVNPGVTEVSVAMDIQGALESPELRFAIGFPEYETSDAALLAQVNSALAAPEEVERQAFALLATGQFIPAGGSGNLFSQTATAQASELLSSRVSELLSGLSEDLDIGVRYVPANAGSASSGSLGGGDNPDAFRSEDAFELDLGLRLLNDRLNIAGTVGAQGMDGLSLEGSEFRGGVDVRYKLTPDGRWEIQGYRLPESELDEEPRQGIGAAYQLRFDRFRDLFRRKDTP